MKLQSIKRGLQRGFTLVELAIVLVIAGLILTAVLKGTDSVNKAKAERAVADLKGLQGLLLEYQKRTGRLPGDCNNEGKIGYTPPNGKEGPTVGTRAASVLDSKETSRLLTAVDAAGCADVSTSEADINVVWNDLRRNNIVDPQRLPAELAKNVNGTYYAVGNMTEKAGAGAGAATTNNANVIVVYGIPVWMAEAIDVAIDGTTQYSGNTGDAKQGRVRRWDNNVTGGQFDSTTVAGGAGGGATFNNGYQTGTETRDTLVSILFQFDTNKLPN